MPSPHDKGAVHVLICRDWYYSDILKMFDYILKLNVETLNPPI